MIVTQSFLTHILFRGTIENTFSIPRPFTTVSCISQNKNLTRKTQMVLRTGPSFLGFRAEYSVNAQTEPKSRILLRFAQTEPRPYDESSNVFRILFRFSFVTTGLQFKGAKLKPWDRSEAFPEKKPGQQRQPCKVRRTVRAPRTALLK